MCPGCAHGVASLPDLPRRHGQGLAGNWGIAVNPAKFGACLRFAGSHSTLGGREVQHLPGLPLLLWAFWLPSTSGFVVLICFVLFSRVRGKSGRRICSEEPHKQLRSLPAARPRPRSLPAARRRAGVGRNLPPSFPVPSCRVVIPFLKFSVPKAPSKGQSVGVPLHPHAHLFEGGKTYKFFKRWQHGMSLVGTTWRA